VQGARTVATDDLFWLLGCNCYRTKIGSPSGTAARDNNSELVPNFICTNLCFQSVFILFLFAISNRTQIRVLLLCNGRRYIVVNGFRRRQKATAQILMVSMSAASSWACYHSCETKHNTLSGKVAPSKGNTTSSASPRQAIIHARLDLVL
jgi:hypothetical protein